MDNKKSYTFAGGPTMAPDFLRQALDEKLFDPELSLLNLNSNDKQCKLMMDKVRQNFVKLLNIPNDYHIWFSSGGIHLQFAGIAMNYSNHSQNVVANYTTTGWFSRLAFNQGKKFLKAHSIVDMQKDQNGQFKLPEEYDYAPNAAYTHFVDNQTVQGLQYPDDMFPYQPGVPLLDDCSSSIFTKPIDWGKVSMAYAHAQKNCGISGATIIIVKQNFLKTTPCSYIPEICDFRVYQERQGFPQIFNSSAVYAMLKMSQNLIDNGGIDRNRFEKRANKLYDVLDRHPIFLPKVSKPFRSRINVTWECKTAQISEKCISEGIQNGLYQFKGHRTVGGFRASLFNPICQQAVQKLTQFLDKFGEKYSQK